MSRPSATPLRMISTALCQDVRSWSGQYCESLESRLGREEHHKLHPKHTAPQLLSTRGMNAQRLSYAPFLPLTPASYNSASKYRYENMLFRKTAGEPRNAQQHQLSTVHHKNRSTLLATLTKCDQLYRHERTYRSCVVLHANCDD